MALTGKKQKFADAVFAGFSNKEAAIRAGYSEASAGPAGSRLVKDADIVAYLEKKQLAPPPTRGKAGKPTSSKPEAPPPEVSDETDPLEFLRGVMSGRIDANITQVKAATSMLPFTHKRLGETSKKAQAEEDAAEVAGAGKYKTRTGPRGSTRH
jgi:phage terminase small subunit